MYLFLYLASNTHIRSEARVNTLRASSCILNYLDEVDTLDDVDIDDDVDAELEVDTLQ